MKYEFISRKIKLILDVKELLHLSYHNIHINDKIALVKEVWRQVYAYHHLSYIYVPLEKCIS